MMVSLVISLLVVLVGGLLSFFHLWEVFIPIAGCHLNWPKCNSPFGDLDHNDSKLLSTSLQVSYAFWSNVFNILVAPALLSTIIGITVFTWSQGSHLSAISNTVVQGVMYALITGCVVWLGMVALDNRRAIKGKKRLLWQRKRQPDGGSEKSEDDMPHQENNEYIGGYST
jgi:hypothetical protein